MMERLDKESRGTTWSATRFATERATEHATYDATMGVVMDATWDMMEGASKWKHK